MSAKQGRIQGWGFKGGRCPPPRFLRTNAPPHPKTFKKKIKKMKEKGEKGEKYKNCYVPSIIETFLYFFCGGGVV